MKRFVLCALACFAALLFESAYATEEATPEKITPTKQLCKKVNGVCVKHKARKKPKPLAHVKPSIEKGYRPPIFTTPPRTQFAVAAYKRCMYDEMPPGLDRILYALALNLSYRDESDIRGSAEKLGREVCLSDALGLHRYETQAEIDRAKGGELLEVSPQFIIFPDDEGNRLPEERHLARPWAKIYIEAFARDLHTFLLEKHPWNKY